MVVRLGYWVVLVGFHPFLRTTVVCPAPCFVLSVACISFSCARFLGAVTTTTVRRDAYQLTAFYCSACRVGWCVSLQEYYADILRGPPRVQAPSKPDNLASLGVADPKGGCGSCKCDTWGGWFVAGLVSGGAAGSSTDVHRGLSVILLYRNALMFQLGEIDILSMIPADVIFACCFDTVNSSDCVCTALHFVVLCRVVCCRSAVLP